MGGCHRRRCGLEQAKTFVCVSDGIIWIWNLMFICFAYRIEILGWWHAVKHLWTITNARLAPDADKSCVVTQQHTLVHTHLRQVLRQVRLLFPIGILLPEAVRQAIAYLFANRHHMCYRRFRQAGYSIGSGTVESACEVVVQQRIKQAGMRASATEFPKCANDAAFWLKLAQLHPQPREKIDEEQRRSRCIAGKSRRVKRRLYQQNGYAAMDKRRPDYPLLTEDALRDFRYFTCLPVLLEHLL